MSEATAQALYNILNRISPNEFCRIAIYKYAKEARVILSITHEGTSTMKQSKIQMLTTKFESIKMKGDKTFCAFYSKLSGIVNSSFNLGDKILN